MNGGVQLIVQTGNQYYFAVLIQNVGGPGSVVAVSVSNGKGAFMPMKRSYGAVWEINNYDIRGAALSFRLTGYNGQILALPNAIPALWQAKALYTTPLNFDLVPRPVAKQVLPAKTAQTGIVPNVGGPGQLKNVAGAQPLAQLRPLVPKYADIIRPARAAMATLGEETSGACGFLNYPRINVYKAGFSPVIFQGGFVCGACFRVSCTNSKQCLPGSVLVQVRTPFRVLLWNIWRYISLKGCKGSCFPPPPWSLCVRHLVLHSSKQCLPVSVIVQVRTPFRMLRHIWSTVRRR